MSNIDMSKDTSEKFKRWAAKFKISEEYIVQL